MLIVRNTVLAKNTRIPYVFVYIYHYRYLGANNILKKYRFIGTQNASRIAHSFYT